MVENTEKVVVALAPTNVFERRSKNIFDHMNLTTFAYFIAELYSSQITFFEDEVDQMNESMEVLIDAIVGVTYNNGIEDSLDWIIVILEDEYQIEATIIDKLTIEFIAKEGKYEPLNYYRTRAMDFMSISNSLSALS